MKQLLLLLLFGLVLAQCQTTKTKEPVSETTTLQKEDNTKAATTSQSAADDTIALSKEDLPQGKKSYKGQSAAAGGPSNNVIEFFTTDYWLPQFAISQLDQQVFKRYVGVWLKFDPKGGFTGATPDGKDIKGRWQFDTPNNALYIDSDYVPLNGKWAVNRSGFAMVWAARGGQHPQDVQVKLVNSSTPE